jgi:molybdopterin-guanine dinucleotide biosynthesis protein B
VGGSNSGKTTLIEKLISVFVRQGYNIGTIKHVMHHMAFDREGKDSMRHARAGAATVMVDSDQQIAIFKTIASPFSKKGRLGNYVDQYFSDMDFVLAEGYKKEDIPKIEVYRKAGKSDPVCLNDPNLAAMVTDAQINIHVPVFGLEQAESIVNFIVQMNQ